LRVHPPLVLILAVIAGVAGTGCASTLYRLGAAIERARSGVDVHTVGAGAHTLAYLEREGPGPTVVLLHGFAANKDAWLRFVRHLPPEYRVLVFDLPGHGDSTFRRDALYDPPGLARILTQAFDALGLARFHLAGNSLGGWIAILYAADHPGQVESLGLFNAAGVRAPEASELERLLEQGDNPLLVDDHAEFERFLDFVFHERPWLPWPGSWVLAEHFVARADENRKIWRDLSAALVEVTPELPALTLPVLVLWGAEDRVLDPSSVEVFLRHLPAATAVVMADTGHSPIVERPEATARHYTEFLSALPEPSH